MSKGRFFLRSLLVFVVVVVFTLVSSAEPVVIRVQDASVGEWLAGVLHDSIAEFEVQNPDIKIELDTSCYWNECKTKNVLLSASGVAPDILFVYEDVRTAYIRQGLLLDITKFVEEDPMSVETLLPPLKDAICYEGSYWGMPIMWLPVIAHNNLHAFATAGLPRPRTLYDTGLWTFNGLRDIAKKLTSYREDGGIDQIGVYAFSDYRGLLPFVWGFGGNLFNEDATQINTNDPAVQDAFSYLHGLVNEPQVAELEGCSGVVGGITQGRWGIALWNPVLYHLKYAWQVPGNYDVLPHPTGPVSDETQALLVRMWGISSGTKHPEEAWRFLNHLGSTVTDRIMMDQRQSLPLHVENFVYSMDMHMEHFNSREMVLVLQEVAALGKTLPFALDISVLNALGSELMPVWRNEKSLNEALANLQTSVEAILSDILSEEDI
ncbi:MAG: extracellular solute-binding protein [Limnochordia bacterium]|nr:extracellular solute-binding protein [Limnochordia bacterium]